MGTAAYIGILLQHDEVGKRLKPTLTCDCGTSTALWLIRQIYILKLHCIETIIDAPLQFRSKFALLLNCRDDCILTLYDCFQLFVHILDVTYGNLIHRACSLLAVTCHERHSGTTLKQLDGIPYFIGRKPKFLRDYIYKHKIHFLTARRYNNCRENRYCCEKRIKTISVPQLFINSRQNHR